MSRMDRKSSGSMSSLSGSGTFTPPMSPRTEGATGSLGTPRGTGKGGGIQMQIQQLAGMCF